MRQPTEDGALRRRAAGARWCAGHRTGFDRAIERRVAAFPYRPWIEITADARHNLPCPIDDRDRAGNVRHAIVHHPRERQDDRPKGDDGHHDGDD
jgi:hypothetical protein